MDDLDEEVLDDLKLVYDEYVMASWLGDDEDEE
jgi:hypothetical protein